MISYSVYKVVHLVGVMMVFLSLGLVFNWKKGAMIIHGTGLVLSLVAGFGLLARLGVMHGSLPGWVIAKLVIWGIFGGLTSLLIRKQNYSKPLWFFAIILGGFAAYLAGSKPF